jgi:site-specific recombinase XerD
VFFTVLYQLLEKIDRQSCIAFMEQQDRAGLSRLTINRNRRLATISSLFTELNLLDPATFSRNPVAPLQRNRETRKRKKSLYRRQPVQAISTTKKRSEGNTIPGRQLC